MVGTIPNSLFADLAGPPEDRIWTQPVFLNQFHHVLGVQTAAEIGKDVTKVLIEICSGISIRGTTISITAYGTCAAASSSVKVSACKYTVGL